MARASHSHSMTPARPKRCGRRRGRSRAARAVIVAAILGATAPFARAQTALPPTPEVNTGQLLTPEVDDPLLTPPAAAPRLIASWDEALGLIRAQSPDYITGAQNVVRAEAEKRIALAAVLPILNVLGSYTHQFYTIPIPVNGGTIIAPPKDLFSATGDLSWDILDPRAIYKVGTASENIGVTKLSFSDQRRQIAMSVVHAMLATLAAER